MGKLEAELHQRNAQTRESERAGSQNEQQGQDRRNYYVEFLGQISERSSSIVFFTKELENITK